MGKLWTVSGWKAKAGAGVVLLLVVPVAIGRVARALDALYRVGGVLLPLVAVLLGLVLWFYVLVRIRRIRARR
jgi:hypothetical protein